MVPICRRLVDDRLELQLLHTGQRLAEQVIQGDRSDQGRIHFRLEVVAVHPGDGPPGSSQAQLRTQTELGIQPPTVSHDRSSSSSAFAF
jgi:hypothetical protein